MIKILKFTTPTCPVCKQLYKVLSNLREEIEVMVEEHNALESPLAVEYKIASVPTLVILKDDKEIGRTVSMTDKSTIKKIING